MLPVGHDDHPPQLSPRSDKRLGHTRWRVCSGFQGYHVVRSVIGYIRGQLVAFFLLRALTLVACVAWYGKVFGDFSEVVCPCNLRAAGIEVWLGERCA